MATLYVNPDHGSSSDAGDYTAAQNSATPLKTITRAAVLAQLSDTINVYYGAAANPSDAHGETDVYAAFVDDTFGGGVITNKNADSGRITVQGVSVGGKAPRLHSLMMRELHNWRFDNFQFGYDLGSGFEYDTTSTIIGIKDCEFSNVEFTGGIANLLGWYGHNRWVDCQVTSKVLGGGSFMEGVGIRCLAHYNDDISAGADDWVEFSGCDFHLIRGEDAMQFLGSVGIGNALIEDCTFNDILQNSEAHTDAVQTTGLQALIIRRSTFGVVSTVSSMVIGSDSTTTSTLDVLVMENNLFVGSPEAGFSTQFGGVRDITIRHNTWVLSNFAGLRFYPHSIPPDQVTISNNIIDKYQVDGGIGWDDTDQFNNVISSGPTTSLDVTGFPEFGDSVDTSWELANTPINSLGIDDAATSSILTDRIGRSRKGSAPDCGCHESDPTVAVTVNPRGPIYVSSSPGSGQTGVNSGVNVVVTLYPKPGEELDPSTVTTSSAYVTDPTGQVIPAVVTIGDLESNGQQTFTIDMKQSISPSILEGDLFPLVTYTAHLTSAIEDTEGSALTPAGWSFTIVGPGGPAIYADGGGPTPPDPGTWIVSLA